MNTKQKIQDYFLLHPTAKLRVRQIERKVKVALPSAIRYAKELEKEGILHRTIIGGVTFYTANFGEEAYLLEKKLFNLRQLHSSGLLHHLIINYDNPTIVLFGSYAKGEDTEESDIDLYIETPHEEIKGLEPFEEKLQREIQMFIHKNINEIGNKELIVSILNGVTLNGFVEVFNEHHIMGKLPTKRNDKKDNS